MPTKTSFDMHQTLINLASTTLGSKEPSIKTTIEPIFQPTKKRKTEKAPLPPLNLSLSLSDQYEMFLRNKKETQKNTAYIFPDEDILDFFRN